MPDPRRTPKRARENETITVSDTLEPRVNRYYLKTSRKFMAAAVVSLLVLVLYIVFVAVFFGEYVTYDNMKYLVRDIDAMNIGGQSSFEKIVYNADGGADAEYFRGGLALSSPDKYRYYDTSGVLLVEENLGYASPLTASSEKYLLIYDLDGQKYSVFNQLTRIIEREAGTSLLSADIANDGSYVLARRSTETKYVVELYNGGFTNVMSIYKDNYVTDVSISPDGNTVAVVSACPDTSDFSCEIDICRRGKSESVKKITLEHSMPLDVEATDKGFVLVCSSEIVFFDKNGENLTEKQFTGMSLRYADINGSTAAVVGTTNALGSENRLLVIDTGDNFGKILLDRTYSLRIMGVYASRNPDDCLCYLKLHDTAAQVLPDGEISSRETDGEIISLVPMKTGALVCTRTAAYRLFGE